MSTDTFNHHIDY